MSSSFARARDVMRGLRIAWVIVAMAAKSPSEAMAKPASMISTPRSSRACALEDLEDLEDLQGMRHGQLFLRHHAAARRLLAVAQRGVKEDNVIICHGTASGGRVIPAFSVSYMKQIGRAHV